MAFIAKVQGKTQYKFDIDRPLEKLAITMTAETDGTHLETALKELGITENTHISVKISSKNGKNINICNNLKIKELADYGQWLEGFIKHSYQESLNPNNENYEHKVSIYFPIGNGGDIILENQESISIEINEVNPKVELSLHTLESEALTTKYYKYNQFATNHGVKNLNITNASSLIIDKENFQELDINFENNNNTNYRKEEMDIYMTDTNDVCFVSQDRHDTLSVSQQQRAKYGTLFNYILDIVTATNLELHAKKDKVCSFIAVEIGNKGTEIVVADK